MVRLGNVDISIETRPKIIAEIGINHQGDLDLAKTMAELAAANGADIIKTQLHIADAEMSDSAKTLVPGHCDKSIYEIMEECSLTIEEEYKLKEFIESLGVTYLCTPFSAKAAHILGDQFKVGGFKIGSGECNNDVVLEAVASYRKPVIISTGMNTLDSCRRTYKLMHDQFGLEIILMHTTNLYPTPEHLVRLGGICELQQVTGSQLVGLSDHTTDNLACLGAIALGAVLVERHFTDSMERKGPDIENSMDPKSLRELRSETERMFLMRGGSKLTELVEEQGTREFAFATYVATKEIPKGSVITEESITPKRPGTGDFFAKDRRALIGKSAILDIQEGQHILKEHLDG